MTLDDLNAELASWPDSNRNEQDLRFGQYIAWKYGVEFGGFGGTFDVEDKVGAYNALVEWIRDDQGR